MMMMMKEVNKWSYFQRVVFFFLAIFGLCSFSSCERPKKSSELLNLATFRTRIKVRERAVVGFLRLWSLYYLNLFQLEVDPSFFLFLAQKKRVCL